MFKVNNKFYFVSVVNFERVIAAWGVFNLFQANFLILYPLKTPGTLVFWCFQGV